MEVSQLPYSFPISMPSYNSAHAHNLDDFFRRNNKVHYSILPPVTLLSFNSRFCHNQVMVPVAQRVTPMQYITGNFLSCARTKGTRATYLHSQGVFYQINCSNIVKSMPTANSYTSLEILVINRELSVFLIFQAISE